ncbi:PREDICTED: elongator complex protein 6 [Dufourea novaeangliae]|uniref:Elongator complex protein 6 n=1 Tax=Dufourea novaeangliae TaxID=178035 RepID=A0A154P888_DUFNO|nr:PREDICTED: elongator complex protein 6 [Dufourea novaeangliae]KZC07330.1 Elongator complex protein 6 like protein [Dufourea novaeangliae]
MDPVTNVLGIDKVDMGGKFILIEERPNSNAHFVLNSIIINALNKNYGICFVLFHSTFNHYHNVGMKFGYNLTMLRAEGKVNLIEPMKIIASNIQCTVDEETHKLQEADTKVTPNISSIINDSLCRTIRNGYYEMTKNNHVVIVIDDLSHLYNLGFTLRDSMYCLRYIRSLIEHDNTSQLCIVIHTYERELQSCIANVAADTLKHMAHLFVIIDSLETGYSSDMSGKITINWRIDCIRRTHNWSEISKYLYKLSDRQVKIYTSGH